MLMITTIIAFVVLACVCLGIYSDKASRKYDREHLGQVRVLTNGDAYIVQQYGMCGGYIDRWSSYTRECEMVFFKEQKDDNSDWVIPHCDWRSQ